jgi:hypothetical protein
MSANLIPAVLAALLIGVWSAAQQVRAGGPEPAAMQKIRFDLSILNDDGLYGPPDGLRSLHYEFCIPATDMHVAEVSAIDPSVEIMRGSRGRIGCADDQFLCVGSTHQPGFREVLTGLAGLPYIERIEQWFGE